jgi:hypothetical protein
MMPGWIAASAVASLAGVSDRRIRSVITEGGKWRDAQLVSRKTHGRGGRAGLQYEILIASLPPGIQEALKAHFTEEKNALRDDGAAERDWWSLTLAPALAHARYSRERSAAIDAILARPLTDWRGQHFVVSRRTIDRKLRAYEDDGAGGLAPRVRKDKGIKRTVISKTWDRLARDVGADELAIQKVAVELQGYVRGLYTNGTSPAAIAILAAAKLRELSNAADLNIAGWPDSAFDVPRRFIEAESRFHNVAIFDRDRKAYEDAKPRILRTRDGLEPMQVVAGDVHHLDICMHRPDGSIAWSKAIAWLDLATNRIWLDVVLLGPGEGVRNADVIVSFIRMCTAWGMPRSLYLDNGSEYRWSDFIDDALKLIARIEYADDRRSQIIRAKPYNAPAKVIETIFRVLEYSYFRTIPGWAGGDRTNKKTEKVGRPTAPFPGTIDELRTALASYISNLYEIRPQRGALKGRSPRQVYNAAVEAGWRRVAIDARELHTVFATDEKRTLRQGYVSFAGDKWTCPELQSYLGNVVLIRAPKFEHPLVLPVLDAKTRELIGFAERAVRYGILDPAGAREAAAMDRRQRGAIRALRQAAPDIDVSEEIRRIAANASPALVAPIAATVGISDEAAAIARGIAEPEIARQRRRVNERERKMQKRLAAYGKSKPGAAS